jgi:hypothetical protein
MEETEKIKYKMKDAKLELDMFNQKYLKKYLFAIGAISIGIFMGGVVTLGIFAGLFAAVGTGLSMERLKEAYPEVYNWIIDHPGPVEILTTIAFAGAFGLTATGIVGGLVANILSSVVLDYYAEQEGKVQGVETLTLGAMIKKLFGSIANMFKTIKNEVVGAINDLRNNKELITVQGEVVAQATTEPSQLIEAEFTELKAA